MGTKLSDSGADWDEYERACSMDSEAERKAERFDEELRKAWKNLMDEMKKMIRDDA